MLFGWSLRRRRKDYPLAAAVTRPSAAVIHFVVLASFLVQVPEGRVD